MGRADTDEDFKAFDQSFLKENILNIEEPVKEEEIKIEKNKIDESISLIEEVKPE